MSDLNELERRIAAIEERVALEASMRAALDGDLANLDAKVRATHHLVQALSITQSEHTRLLESAHDKLDRIVAMLEAL